MDKQATDIRALSIDECDGVSGGLGWFALALALGGGAAAGTIVGILTASKVPKIEFPPERP
jgi:hypothetical protein